MALKLQALQYEINQKDSQIEKVRLNNAEITKEMVEATNESGRAQNESRLLRDKLKRAEKDAQKYRETLEAKEQELEQIKNESFGHF